MKGIEAGEERKMAAERMKSNSGSQSPNPDPQTQTQSGAQVAGPWV